MLPVERDDPKGPSHEIPFTLLGANTCGFRFGPQALVIGWSAWCHDRSSARLKQNIANHVSQPFRLGA